MKFYKPTAFFCALILLFLHGSASARGFRVSQIPNGNQNNCKTCHQFPSGGPRNSFGAEIEQNFLSAPGGSFGSVVWGPALAGLDSDNDGSSNGAELNDPNGAWSTGNTNPGDPATVTNPGEFDAAPVPNLSTWAIWTLSLLFSALAFWQLQGRKPSNYAKARSFKDTNPRRN